MLKVALNFSSGIRNMKRSQAVLTSDGSHSLVLLASSFGVKEFLQFDTFRVLEVKSILFQPQASASLPVNFAF
jgi:hypothetical protein